MHPEADNRSEGRSNVFLSAVLVSPSGATPVRVRNLSSRGALVDGGSLPARGTRARLVRGELGADAEVAWQSAGHAGIRFTAEIEVGEWVKAPRNAGQQRVDDALAALRRKQPIPEHLELAGAPSLGEISRELDSICERLAADPQMTIAFGEELVRLDALARKLEQLSRT